MRPCLGVYGTWRAVPGDAVYEAARRAGAIAAQRGWSIVTGGYSGVMEGAARGARDAGGGSVGVLCPEIDRLLSPNQFSTLTIREPNLLARQAKCLELATTFLFFPGRTGTAAELVQAIELVSKGERAGPVALWGDHWVPLLSALATANSSLTAYGLDHAPPREHVILHSQADLEGWLDVVGSGERGAFP